MVADLYFQPGTNLFGLDLPASRLIRPIRTPSPSYSAKYHSDRFGHSRGWIFSEAFKKNWDDLSMKAATYPNPFLKTDVIMKNPAPSHVQPPDVLKQVANF